MPFVTACPFCPHKLKVPDPSIGASLRCPKCGNYFTVVPAELSPVKQPVRPPVVESRAAPAAEPPAADLPWWVETPPNPVPLPAPVAAEPPPPPPMPAPVVAVPFFPEPPRPRPASNLPGWINAWGAIAFLLASLALLLAAFALPRFLTISFAALGFLLGLAGLVAHREEWKLKDGVWLLLGGGGSGLLLILAWLSPGTLSVRWGMDFDVPEPDRNKQVLVSRDNTTEVRELGGDRADAEKNAIRQGDILVRVESAVVDQPAEKAQPALLITLHIANVGQLHNITYHGQARDEHRAIVRDSRGKELQRRAWTAPDKKKGGPLGEVSLLPIHEVKDVVAVEPPWSGTAHVELDLPAAAWGREGVCKFTIPRTFILHKNRSK